MARKPILTVREVIERLQQQPPDAYVMVEGCDCCGYANDVEQHDAIDGVEAEWEELTAGKPVVLINRRQ